jgi:uncharacterized protein
MSTAAIRELVREECARGSFGPAFFEEHLAVVARYGERLARELGADAEIVELAAWLHDLAAVRDPAALPEHARLSAALARELLPAYGFSGGTIDRVARAIASHSSPLALGSGTLEEVCLSQADAVAQIVRPAWWFYFAFTVRKCGFDEGRRWLLGLWESRWNSLIGPARALVGDLYSQARALLE